MLSNTMLSERTVSARARENKAPFGNLGWVATTGGFSPCGFDCVNDITVTDDPSISLCVTSEHVM